MRHITTIALAIGFGLLFTPSAQAQVPSFGTAGMTYDVGPSAAAKAQAGYARLVGAGMDRLRLELSWAQIQPTSGRYDWSHVDTAFNELPAGVQVLALFNNSPAWARDSNHKQVCGATSAMSCRMPPAESRLKDWQKFVQAALLRYGAKIDAVEAWNEPNLVNFWRPAVDPARWARLMKATATAARAARPGVRMVSGGAVGGTGNDARSVVGPIPFFERAFAAVPTLANDIDLYGLHPYARDACGAFAEPWLVQRPVVDACTATGWDIERHRYVVQRFDPTAAIAVTEFGYHTEGTHGIDELTQRDWLLEAYDWFAQQPDVHMLLVMSLFDTWWNWSPDERSYGMVAADNRAKPAWEAFNARTLTAGG